MCIITFAIRCSEVILFLFGIIAKTPYGFFVYPPCKAIPLKDNILTTVPNNIFCIYKPYIYVHFIMLLLIKRLCRYAQEKTIRIFDDIADAHIGKITRDIVAGKTILPDVLLIF